MKKFAPVFLSESELPIYEKEIKGTPEQQKKWQALLFEKIKPFHYFALSICRQLQERENSLSARDAYWIGAIDEIMGATSFVTQRMVMENQAPSPPASQTASSTNEPQLPVSQSPPASQG